MYSAKSKSHKGKGPKNKGNYLAMHSMTKKPKGSQKTDSLLLFWLIMQVHPSIVARVALIALLTTDTYPDVSNISSERTAIIENAATATHSFDPHPKLYQSARTTSVTGKIPALDMISYGIDILLQYMSTVAISRL